MMMNYKRSIYPLSALFLSLALFACSVEVSVSQTPSSEAPPPEVVVKVVQPEDLLLQSVLPGRVVASQTAEIRPQVTGIILERLFEEGSLVKAGDELYQIDPQPYEAALKQAEAALASAEAQALNAKATAERTARLVGTQAVSKQTADDAEAAYQQAQANVLGAEAALKTAQINLDYTLIKAPISGRIGKSSVTAGALVVNGQAQNLAIIQTLDPINVDITLSANEYSSIRNKITTGQIVTDVNAIQVALSLDGGQLYSEKGKIHFSDLNVDTTTSSVLLQAVFANPNNELLPGMFVRATVDQGLLKDVYLLPQSIVTHAPTGDYLVWVVGEDNVAKAQPITVDGVKDNQWIVISGLNAGDKVVLEGSLAIQSLARTGQPVLVNPVTEEEKIAAEQAKMPQT